MFLNQSLFTLKFRSFLDSFEIPNMFCRQTDFFFVYISFHAKNEPLSLFSLNNLRTPVVCFTKWFVFALRNQMIESIHKVPKYFFDQIWTIQLLLFYIIIYWHVCFFHLVKNTYVYEIFWRSFRSIPEMKERISIERRQFKQIFASVLIINLCI